MTILMTSDKSVKGLFLVYESNFVSGGLGIDGAFDVRRKRELVIALFSSYKARDAWARHQRSFVKSSNRRIISVLSLTRVHVIRFLI